MKSKTKEGTKELLIRKPDYCPYETLVSGQHVEHKQGDRPSKHIYEHDMFKFQITP